MGSLGSLGTPKQAIDLHFDWFGHTIRVAPYASDLIELDFLQAAGKIDLAGVDLAGAGLDMRAIAAVSDAARMAVGAAVGSVRQLIHTDDWDLFWSTAIANGQNLDDLLAVQKAITEAVTGFPTGRRSGSTPGPSNTPTSSEAVSSSPEPADLSDADRALQAWAGRPDLQEFVVMAEEARARRAAVG